MKTIKQIEKERIDYLKMAKVAHKEDDAFLYAKCLGVIATLDWVRGNRNNTEEVIDFIHLRNI